MAENHDNPPKRAFSNHAIHLVRTMTQVNLTLSQMADQKANILMGATFLVFTLSVGQARSGQLSAALVVLALSAFLSALCAVFAVLPSVNGAKPPKPGARLNKLFFGVFTQMDEAEWTEAVLDDLQADETVFRAMLHDAYQNGQVLQHKKYKYLALAYRIFIAGLTVTLITFGIELFHGPLWTR